MKTTVNFSDFVDAFRVYEREDNFSYEGKRALFDYLEQLEEDTGEEMELDVIALCCDWNEGTWEEIAREYRIELTDPEDKDKTADEVREYLEYHSCIAGEVPGGCVYLAF